MEKSISRQGESRGGRITIVASLSSAGVAYKVTDTSCTCPHHVNKGAHCKHMVLRPALERIRSLDRSEPAKERIEERLLDLARHVYSRPRRGETSAASYDLLMEASGERFAPDALVDRALSRHRAVLDREDAEYERSLRVA